MHYTLIDNYLMTKHFFYPGFTEGTGGLLRESALAARRDAFDRANWLEQQPIPWQGERLISLFCYEPPALAHLLGSLQASEEPTRLLVTPGRATAAVKTCFQNKNLPEPAWNGDSLLSISYLPYFTQTDFDHLLWASDLNFVRGEDSVVRALWAGQAFVWQIYPQDDGAHGPKLEAFLDWLQAPPSLRHFHRVWNGLEAGPLPAIDMPLWQAVALAARERLLAQDDLATQLAQFIQKNR